MGKKWGQIPRKYFAILFVFFWFRGGISPSFTGQGFFFVPPTSHPQNFFCGLVALAGQKNSPLFLKRKNSPPFKTKQAKNTHTRFARICPQFSPNLSPNLPTVCPQLAVFFFRASPIFLGFILYNFFAVRQVFLLYFFVFFLSSADFSADFFIQFLYNLFT